MESGIPNSGIPRKRSCRKQEADVVRDRPLSASIAILSGITHHSQPAHSLRVNDGGTTRKRTARGVDRVQRRSHHATIQRR